jgi:thioester reductase-like protein
VTLTGITGYIGAETCLQFLKDGGFRVRGTVRDKKNEAKITPIREAFGHYFE